MNLTYYFNVGNDNAARSLDDDRDYAIIENWFQIEITNSFQRKGKKRTFRKKIKFLSGKEKKLGHLSKNGVTYINFSYFWIF